MNLKDLEDLSVQEINEIYKDFPPEKIRAVKRKRTLLRNRKHAGNLRFWFLRLVLKALKILVLSPKLLRP